jgi:hypothetical protein
MDSLPMKKYIVTSTLFMGELSFGYINDQLVFFDITSVAHDRDLAQRLWAKLPTTEADLLGWLKTSKTMKIVEVPMDLSFDNFWNTYGKAYGSKVGNKPKCTTLWKKLNDEDKTLALLGIEPYKRAKQSEGTAMLYPERYLTHETYRNFSHR